MGKLMMLVLANIRKNKGQAVSLFIFILIAAALLNVGLLLLLNFGSSFDRRAEELNAPHYAIVEPEAIYSDRQLTWLKDYPGTTEVQKETAYPIRANITYNEGKIIMSLVFLDVDNPRSMNDLTLMEGTEPRTVNEICLPYLFKVGGGYKLGDSFNFSYGERDFHYVISGFSEDILFGSPLNQTYRIFLPGKGFDELAEIAPEAQSVFLTTQLADPDASERLYQDFTQEFFYRQSIPQVESLLVLSVNITDAKTMRTSMSSVTSVILVVFSTLIVLVSLIIVRFRIYNSIEEGMANIGALKATGYTSAQIIGSYVVQFGLICGVGTLVGITTSYALLPSVSTVLEQQSALVWEQGFDPAISTVSLLALLVVTLAVTLASSSRIRRLQPLEALRGGLSTHSFKRNYFPLERSAGPLPLLLALKTALRSKGQMAMIVLIVTTVSFASAVGLSIYYNLGLNSQTFTNIIGGEIPDASFVTTDAVNARRLHDEFSSDNAVRKAYYYQDVTMLVDDYIVGNIVVEDFALLESKSLLYEGRYPLHDNEIALSGLLAAQLERSMGDTVEVVQGGVRGEYLICGFIQSANNSGALCAMTEEGARRVQPDFEFRQLNVYLDDPATTADFISRVKADNPSEIELTANIQEIARAQLSVYGTIFAAVAVAIFTVTILVVALALYLVLRTAILRRRRAFGVQKALGFTTLQLMNQVSLCYLPAVTLGVLLGAALGAFGFNGIFVALVRSMGIMTASMPAPLDLTLIMCVVLVLIAYGISLLVALSIRRIDPYRLITE
ncbi:MAG: ABC transporter permease [Coriobacteriales bacterium]|jgi:putative ABC transport system permease protein|nr:ABC transporter permease [Coriobacteriales bacterium]